MSWDEALFRSSLRALQGILDRVGGGRPGRSIPATPGQVLLEGYSPRLKLLASALCESVIEVRASEGLGGASRGVMFLPRVMNLCQTEALNAMAYAYRVAFSAQVIKSGVFVREGLSDEQIARETERAVPKIQEALHQALPAAKACFEQLSAAGDPERLNLLFGLLRHAGAALSSDSLGKTEMPGLDALSRGTERKGKTQENPVEVKLSKNPESENPLVHSFEKVHTAEDYRGGNKAKDGSDELDDHAEALDELDLKQVIRSQERTSSVLKCDAYIEAGAPDLVVDEEDVPGVCHRYDEWNEKERSYRREWCSVFESTPRPKKFEKDAKAWTQEIVTRRRREVLELRNQLLGLLNERRWRNRQADGPEIDVDALVDRYATLRSGHSPCEKFFLRRPKLQSDVAVMILVDSSLSTDSWIEDRRVLDVARESVVVLSEVLSGLDEDFRGLGDRVSVASFQSHTRRDCRFELLKGFDEKWSKFAPRIASLEPEGYTRIGPALRHATTLLKATRARKRLLLLISDGKPTDYDRYEGRYGIADVRQAIREAGRGGVRVRALAVDSEARFYLPRMFGEGNFQVLRHPTQLCGALARIFSEAIA